MNMPALTCALVFAAASSAGAAAVCDTPLSIPAQALCELTGNDTAAVGSVLASDRGLDGAIWAMSDSDYISFMDWKTESKEAVAWFDALLAKRDLPALIDAEKAELIRKGEAEWGHSVPLEAIGPMMDVLVQQRGARLLYVDTGSDSYGFAIVDVAYFDRWQGVKLSQYLRLAPLDNDVQRLDYGDDAAWRITPRGSPAYQ